MTTKQERLKEVYDYLRANHGIHTQIDLAKIIHITRPALSSAINGNEAYLTNNLFAKICAAFPGVFNLDYLLTGKGDLLAEQVIHDDGVIQITEQNEPLSQKIDQSSLVNAVLAAKDETIATLRDQIATLNELISGLRDEITILKSQSDRVNYHFPIGVADDHQKPIDSL